LEILGSFIARETVILNIYQREHNNYLRNIALKASLGSLSNLTILFNRSASTLILPFGKFRPPPHGLWHSMFFYFILAFCFAKES